MRAPGPRRPCRACVCWCVRRRAMPPTPSPRLTLSETAPAIAVSHRKDALCRGPGIPCLTKSKGNGSGTSGRRRAKVSTLAAHPAMGWTSPLPAVRMRAAMLVSAVVATCRGRLRRGAIREEVLADELHEWRRLSCDLSQPDCLRVVPVAPKCTRTQIIADAFVGCRRLAR